MTRNPSNILIAYNSCWYVWIFRMPLIRALQERGSRVTVAAPRDEYTERLVGAGVAFREIRLRARGKNPLEELRTFVGFFKACRKTRPVVVLLYTIKPNLYCSLAARVLRIPVIANVTGLGAIFEKEGALRALVRLIYRAAFARAACVFFQNPDDRDVFLHARLVSTSRADLLPGSGVDLTRFAPRPRGSGKFTFLFVGRLLRAKGVEDLLAASRIVKGKGRDVRIVLLGKRDDRDPEAADPRLLDAALDEGMVELPGNVDDVRSYLAGADCVVLPSYYREGTPRSLLEAAAMGKPIIAADSIGTREPIVDGKNGLLCRPRSPEDLAARMIEVLDLPEEARRRMGSISRRLAEQRFDERIVIRKYLDVIDRVVGKA